MLKKSGPDLQKNLCLKERNALMVNFMPITPPEDQWPPLAPHMRGEEIVKEIVWKQTREVLLGIHKRYRSAINDTTPDHLLLSLEESDDVQRPFGFSHGLKRPKNERLALWVPPRNTIAILNDLETPDATQIASALCYDYAMDKWETDLLREALENAEDEEDARRIREDFFSEKEGDEEELDALETEELLAEEEAAFLSFYRNQEELREIYRAIVLGQISEERIYIDPEKRKK